MSVPTSAGVPGFRGPLQRLVYRPTEMAEGTRWLFCLLAVASLLIVLPGELAGARGPALLLVLGAIVVLSLSSMLVYKKRRVPLGLELLDSVAITCLTLGSPNPLMVTGYVFAAVWFRGLYGSTWRSYLRAGLYISAVGAAYPLWQLVHGHGSTPAAAGILTAVPSLLITVIVARHLGGGLTAREQNVRRDRALARVSSELFGTTDENEIRAFAWAAAAEICAATPGLRVLKVHREGPTLLVDGVSGSFATTVAELPGAVIASSSADRDAVIEETTDLDRAVGAEITWVGLRLYRPLEQSWLIVGAPKAVPVEALLSIRSLADQVGLALDNSTSRQALTVQARHDSLTGLANRSEFVSVLAAELALDRRGGNLHVLFIDLDDFKDVNDVLGHRAGDEVLIEVGNRLRACAGADDVCARLGGDEFAVLLRGSADAARLAQRMVDYIATPVHLSGCTRRVGASIGIATAGRGTEIEELVHQADVAMYAAKAQGKGRVQSFDSGLLQADSTRLKFERQLAAATGAGEIVVHYQPVLTLPGLGCTAVEALVRWQHPTAGLIQPQGFIEAAERTGAIIDIGAFALRRACQDFAGWENAYPGASLSVHVNVSARQLDHDDFIDMVVESLADCGMSAHQLVLELTETVLLNSVEAIGRVKALADIGVQIAIDDFGTGYSSLTTLRTLPVNIVKLDTSFIAGALANSADRTVLKAIVQMSTQLGLRTVAEGVERPEQQEFLEAIGTSGVQGFLYLRAVPAEELTTWLRTNLAAHAAGPRVVLPFRLAGSVGLTGA